MGWSDTKTSPLVEHGCKDTDYDRKHPENKRFGHKGKGSWLPLLLCTGEQVRGGNKSEGATSVGGGGSNTGGGG